MANNNVYLASKPRYEILDVLRGVAAMLVVAYHLFETYYHGAPDQPINPSWPSASSFSLFSWPTEPIVSTTCPSVSG